MSSTSDNGSNYVNKLEIPDNMCMFYCRSDKQWHVAFFIVDRISNGMFYCRSDKQWHVGIKIGTILW